MFLSSEEQIETGRWTVLATFLNGANDSGKYDHINTAVVVKHVNDGDVFDFLATELPGRRVWARQTHRCSSSPNKRQVERYCV